MAQCSWLIEAAIWHRTAAALKTSCETLPAICALLYAAACNMECVCQGVLPLLPMTSFLRTYVLVLVGKKCVSFTGPLLQQSLKLAAGPGQAVVNVVGEAVYCAHRRLQEVMNHPHRSNSHKQSIAQQFNAESCCPNNLRTCMLQCTPMHGLCNGITNSFICRSFSGLWEEDLSREIGQVLSLTDFSGGSLLAP